MHQLNEFILITFRALFDVSYESCIDYYKPKNDKNILCVIPAAIIVWTLMLLIVAGLGTASVVLGYKKYKDYSKYLELRPFELNEGELALIEEAKMLNTPAWARDPISHDIMLRPRLTITEDLDPNSSQSYDAYSIHILLTQFKNNCALTRKAIQRNLPNIALTEAIIYWIKSHRLATAASTNQRFFNADSSPHVEIPSWAKSAISGNLMVNPCICFIDREARSIDRSEAEERSSSFFINRNLREAIEHFSLSPQQFSLPNHPEI